MTQSNGNTEITITRWLSVGELAKDPSHLMTIEEVLRAAGRCLDKCASGEIIGDAYFEAADGKVYRVVVEALIEPVDEETAQEKREELEAGMPAEDSAGPVEVFVVVHEPKPDTDLDGFFNWFKDRADAEETLATERSDAEHLEQYHVVGVRALVSSFEAATDEIDAQVWAQHNDDAAVIGTWTFADRIDCRAGFYAPTEPTCPACGGTEFGEINELTGTVAGWFERGEDGSFEFQGGGETDIDWDSEEVVARKPYECENCLSRFDLPELLASRPIEVEDGAEEPQSE